MKKGQILTLILLYAAGILLFLVTGETYAMIFLAVLTVLVIIGAVIVLLSGKKLSVTVTGGQSVSRGHEMGLRVQVENAGRMPAADMVLPIRVRNLLTGETEEKELHMSVPGKGAASSMIQVRPEHCGCIEAAVDAVRIREPLGLLGRNRRADARGRGWVLPTAGNYPLTESQIYQYDMESYKYSQDRSGTDPSETFNIREYVAGDNMKSIHWKLSAKAGDLMIREPGLPVENNVLVIWDKCLKAEPARIDELADVTASVCRELLDKEIVHSLGWYDSTGKRFQIRDISGEESLWQALMEAMSSPFGDEAASSVYHFIEMTEEKNWSNYILVSGRGDDLERLRNYGEVTLAGPGGIE